MRLLRLLFAVFVFTLISSCTRKASEAPVSPEQRVAVFVKQSAEATGKESLQSLLQMCQGRLREAFQKMTPEAFEMAYLKTQTSLIRFEVVQTKVEGVEATIHYLAHVLNRGGSIPTEESVEREVHLVQVDGQWFLETISPIGVDQIAFLNGMIL